MLETFNGCLCDVVSTCALLHAGTNAVVVNNEGIKYPSELPTVTALFLTKL